MSGHRTEADYVSQVCELSDKNQQIRYKVALLEQSLRIAIDTLLVYASHNPHGPKAAQDTLLKLANIACERIENAQRQQRMFA